MCTTEEFHTIALTMLPKVGPVTIGKLIAKFGSAEAVFQLNKAEKLALFKTELDWDAVLRQAEAEIAFTQKHRVQILFPHSPAYPPNLQECTDKPPVLYVRGTGGWESRKCIAFVGTRSPSAEARKKIEMLLDGLRPHTPVIISGLAAGIDTFAHELACDMGFTTVGVLGNSLSTIYPAANKALAKRMIGQGGLLTEFYSTSGVDKINFVRRNRIIAGMSLASIIVESKERGGALLTAEYAQGYFRDVFAVPGSIFDEKAHGCNNLIRDNKAAIITCSDDLVRAMNWDIVTKPKPAVQAVLFDFLPAEQKVVDYLRQKGRVHLDIIKAEAGLTNGELATTLLSLEMAGHIKSLPGNLFCV